MNAGKRAEREAQRVERIRNESRRSFQRFEDDWEFSVMTEGSPVEQMEIQRAYERTERRMRQRRYR
jgi:hypothetical protein